MKDLIIQARDFAIRAHWGQMYGTRPYLDHLEEVYHILRNEFALLGLGPPAYLHDVLEDTKVTAQEILEAFGEFTLKVVQFCTDEPGANRKTRKAATYARVRVQVDHYLAGLQEYVYVVAGVRVKVADRLANVRSCVATGNTSLLDMYRKEHYTFREIYFIPETCDALWVDLDRALGGAL